MTSECLQHSHQQHEDEVRTVVVGGGSHMSIYNQDKSGVSLFIYAPVIFAPV